MTIDLQVLQAQMHVRRQLHHHFLDARQLIRRATTCILTSRWTSWLTCQRTCHLARRWLPEAFQGTKTGGVASLGGGGGGSAVTLASGKRAI